MIIASENIAINRHGNARDIMYELCFLLSKTIQMCEKTGHLNKHTLHNIDVKNGPFIVATVSVELSDRFRDSPVTEFQKPQ